MAIDVGVGSDTASAYLSVSDADALAAEDLGPEVDAWTAGLPAEKEKALKRATREIDAYLRSGWLRWSPTQALLFPREIDVRSSGPFIPRNVQLATYEQATFVLFNAAVLDRARRRRARDVQMAAEPNLTTLERGGASRSQSGIEREVPMLSDAALAYLAPYAKATGRGLRSVRLASGYVG